MSSGFAIEGPSQAKIECEDQNDGSCDVRYWPTEPGEYAVHVTCDEEDIEHSPFMAFIIPDNNTSFPDKVNETLNKQEHMFRCFLIEQWTLKLGEWLFVLRLQVQAYGPGLEKSGCVVNQPAEFTVNAEHAGKGPLNITAQVRSRSRNPAPNF